MNANPHTCPHLSLIYECIVGVTAFIRCADCHTTWDADEPITDTRVSFDHGDENDTWENHPEWQEDDAPLNPDNEPTSEHNAYSHSIQNMEK